MAKRRTLRRQRDKAVKEAAKYRRMALTSRIFAQTIRQRFLEQLAVLQAQYDYVADSGFFDENRIKRKLLHDLVDGGYFDQAVASRTENVGYDDDARRLHIEVRVWKIN